MEKADLGNGYGLAEIGPATKATQLSKSGGEKDYGRSIRAAARGFLTGVFSKFTFIDSMISTVMRGLTRAFHEGLAKFNVRPEEMTAVEQAALDAQINVQLEHMFGFADFIMVKREVYQGGEKQKALNQVFTRAMLWSNQYDKTRVLGEAFAGKNRPMTWRLGATEEHCKTCQGFNGKTYRFETWRENGALPKVRALCCKGFRCDCRLEPAQGRITPGRFPKGLLCG